MSFLVFIAWYRLFGYHTGADHYRGNNYACFT